MTLLATKQIQLQVDKSLEPKLEVLLAQKVRTTALKTKPFRKEQTFNVKFILNPPIQESILQKGDSATRTFR